MTYLATKTFGHDLGLSACFRQYRAESHCNRLHGYALSFKLVFACEELDETNWVIDFGDFGDVKKFLTDTFDHKLLVARDDPHLQEIRALEMFGLAKVKEVKAVGCEAFAKMVHDFVSGWLEVRGVQHRVHLISVEVREHGANSAVYGGPSA